MLISDVQQSDSVIHIHEFLLISFSIMIFHRILNMVPCAIQWDLVVYHFYVHYFASSDPKFPLHLFPHPLGSHTSVLYICESVLFHR